MSVAAGVTDTAIAVREKLRGKIGQTKVHRYWPGKAPQWADREDEDEDEDENQEEEKKEVRREEVRPQAKEDDPRLRRLAESRRNRDEAVARHRQIRQAEIVSTREEEKVVGDKMPVDEAEEDEDAVEERRRKNRERILQRQREEEAAAAEQEEEEDEEEEEEEDEYETDSEDEHGGIPMIKPVFVKKSERETIAERERIEAEENAMLEEMKRKLELRKTETKQKLLEEIKKEEEQEKEKTEDGAEIDTDDETNEAEEYEAWKAREIARIKREREEKENAVKEREEIEKVRKMSEEERKEWERKNPKESTVVKKKWKYMQKYYHKGAFFQWSTDEKVLGSGGTEILKRDYSDATGEDKLNKSILPKVMQVKNFGRSGRTKWTHLVAEDTTQWDTAWTSNDVLRNKYNNKMAGMNKPIEKPHGSKKMKRNVEDLYKV